MKKLSSSIVASLIATAFGVSCANAAVSVSGAALRNVSGLAAGDIGFMIVDIDASDLFAFNTISISEGASISDLSSYADGFARFGNVATAASGFGAISLSVAANNVPLGGGIDSGDRFAVLVFSQSTDTAIAGDTFTVWTDPSWVIPADGFAVTFPANLTQLSAAATPALIGTVLTTAIPEPSSFAAFAGLAVLGAVATRRRRSA